MAKLWLKTAARFAACLVLPFAVAGCATQRSAEHIVAISYESPRPDGFGWSIVVLPDGLAMVQEGSDAPKYARLADENTSRVFMLA